MPTKLVRLASKSRKISTSRRSTPRSRLSPRILTNRIEEVGTTLPRFQRASETRPKVTIRTSQNRLRVRPTSLNSSHSSPPVILSPLTADTAEIRNLATRATTQIPQTLEIKGIKIVTIIMQREMIQTEVKMAPGSGKRGISVWPSTGRTISTIMPM